MTALEHDAQRLVGECSVVRSLCIVLLSLDAGVVGEDLAVEGNEALEDGVGREVVRHEGEEDDPCYP